MTAVRYRSTLAGLWFATLLVTGASAHAATPDPSLHDRAMAAFQSGDDATARTLAAQACDQGEARGCLVAGFLLKEGFS